VIRWPSARFVTGTTGEQQFQRVALHPHGGGVPIGGDQPVVRLEGGSRAHLGGLLALERGVGGQAALALQGHRLPVVGPGEDHRPVQPEGHLEVDGRITGESPDGVRI
jgi:hypothetical protein